MSQPRARAGGPGVAAALLLAMLSIVLLSVGSTFWFSNVAVQREFRKLPPEVQRYLRAQQAAQRRGEMLPPPPPIPEIRTGTPADPYLDQGDSSPGVNGMVYGGNQELVIRQGKRVRETGQRHWTAPNAPHTQDFLKNVQSSLIQVGFISALASALLAWWLARRVATPITAVSHAAQQLAQGNFSARAPLITGEREVTELALSFNEMAQSLQTLDRERQQAVADIAHELRTPLAIIQARLDALEDGVYPLNTEQITLLSTQAQLLTRLVGDLRTLTLADAGRLSLKLQKIELGAVAQQVAAGLEDRAAQQGIALSAQAEYAPLHADSDRVRQVVANLLENALRHARRQIQLEVHCDGQTVRVHVDDDGSGIAEASRELVFSRFARLDESRARDTGGSGLGLAIVRALALAHGGDAYAEESPLGGARLTVTFPADC